MFVLLLLGCRPRVENPTEDIVVVFSVDTLGAAAARDAGWCGRLQGLVEGYGLTLSCLEGAVAPSSWTGESHTRFLFPAHQQGSGRAARNPECGSESFLGTIRAGVGGRYFFGSDNLVLSSSGMKSCSLTETQWAQGTDRYDDTHEEPEVLALIAEEDRPVHHTLDAYERELRRGKAIQLFVNALEPGGHEPRCWFDPYTDACEELWQVAASHGIWDVDRDRRATWLDSHYAAEFQALFSERLPSEEMRWRGLFWQTTLEAIAAHQETFFDDRLRRILDATRDADRLGDLHLVIVGDHGENPCVTRGGEDPNLNCGHNGIPTEFTGFVPVFVAPSSLAESWIENELVGDGARPWSTVNLAYGLVTSLGVAVPDAWGPMEPVGTATSWTCKTPEAAGGASGIHVEGDVAIRCIGGACWTSGFVLPEDPRAEPASVKEVPDALAAWGGDPDWFTTACAD